MYHGELGENITMVSRVDSFDFWSPYLSARIQNVDINGGRSSGSAVILGAPEFRSCTAKVIQMEYLVRSARDGAAFALPPIKRLSKNRYLRHERQLPSAPNGARPARRCAPVS
ncbi:hypothetical protein EVAR_82545_1 [Eumeta japonica]|uniref:Uncharacterized protein n=1 Tax=Eumeta variegata TaxID=151549 RepID=A0A4C1UWD6_EUMVA|nr:hypothetical protein EVAR_82545_1 [Eumeta japonica]